GSKAKVYHPYVLLKTYEVLCDIEVINVTDDDGNTDIRDLLKKTYMSNDADSPSWLSLADEVKGTEYAVKKLAINNTQLFSKPALEDQEGKQTRLIEIETIPFLIATQISEDKIRLLNGDSISLPIKEFDIREARIIHENIIRVHAWPFEKVKKESVLSFYLKGPHYLALLNTNNQLEIEGLRSNMTIAWNETLGVIQTYDKGNNDESCD
ncbi:MAG: hypothetical protein ABFR35_09100, partial [Thermodesulfobacteriota bacterium]